MVFNKLFCVQPPEVSDDIRYMVMPSSSAHHPRTKIDEFLNAVELCGPTWVPYNAIQYRIEERTSALMI